MPYIGRGVSHHIHNMFSFQRSAPEPEPIGVIIDNDFGSGSWTYFGAGSAAFNPSDITLSGGGSPANLDENGLLSNLVTSCENAELIVQVEVTQSSGVAGSGIGFRNIDNNGSLMPNYFFFVNGSTGGSLGQMLVLQQTALIGNSFPTPGLLSITPPTFLLEYRFVKTFNQIITTVTNLTTPNSISITTDFSNTYGDPANLRSICGAAQLYIENWDGSNKITGIEYSSTDWRYADVLFIGTSKTAGFYAGSKADRYSDLYATATAKKCNNWATSSGVTATVLSQMPQIIETAPKVVVIEIGCNDVRGGISQATWEANIDSIESQLNAAGITVYWMESIPETGGSAIDPTALNAKLATKPNYFTLPGFNTGTMLNPDGVHVNDVGNIYISGVVQSLLP